MLQTLNTKHIACHWPPLFYLPEIKVIFISLTHGRSFFQLILSIKLLIFNFFCILILFFDPKLVMATL